MNAAEDLEWGSGPDDESDVRELRLAILASLDVAALDFEQLLSPRLEEASTRIIPRRELERLLAESRQPHSVFEAETAPPPPVRPPNGRR